MIQVIPVRRAYVSMSCDWPACPERISLSLRPTDLDRDFVDMRELRLLAERRGWDLDEDQAFCPNHSREASWPSSSSPSSSSPTPTGRNTNDHMPIHR